MADWMPTTADTPGRATFGYDLCGNRNTIGYTTISGNRTTAAPGYTFTYDAEGNLVSRTQLNGAGTADDVVTTFAYDHRNRLTGATEKTGGALTMRATYTYDPVDRRIKTNVDPDGAGSNPAVVTWHQNTYADFDAAGAVVKRYLFALALDELLARTAANGSGADWYLPDRLGSIRDIVTASTAAVVYHTAYTAFGAKVSESGTGGDRYGFTAREHDTDTGQRNHRYRSVDLVLDKWTQPDPIGFAAGDTNLYRYVGNSPTNYVDAFGETGHTVVVMLMVSAGIGVEHKFPANQDGSSLPSPQGPARTSPGQGVDDQAPPIRRTEPPPPKPAMPPGGRQRDLETDIQWMEFQKRYLTMKEDQERFWVELMSKMADVLANWPFSSDSPGGVAGGGPGGGVEPGPGGTMGGEPGGGADPSPGGVSGQPPGGVTGEGPVGTTRYGGPGANGFGAYAEIPQQVPIPDQPPAPFQDLTCEEYYELLWRFGRRH